MQVKQYEFDEEFQWKILALMVQEDNLVRDHYDTLHSSFFTNPIFQNLCRIITEFVTKYGVPPSEDILIELVRTFTNRDIYRAEQELYMDITKELYAFSLKGKDYILDQIIGFGKHRALENAILKSVELLKDHEYEKITSVIQEAARVGVSKKNIGSFYLDGADARTLKRSMPPRSVVPTGFADLDKYLEDGGMHAQELAFILAPSSAGKSLMLGNLARNALLNRFKVLYITLEMSIEQIETRLDSMFVETRKKELKHKGENLTSKMKAVKLLGGNIHIQHFPSKSITTNDIIAYIDMLRVTYNFEPDILFVDYADLMNPVDPQKDERLRQAKAFEDLFSLAGTLQIPVWTATQANASAYTAAKEKRNIEMQDASESKNKAFTADLVVSLQSLEKSPDGSTGRSRLYIAKYRHGVSQVAHEIDVNYDTMTMHTTGKQFSDVEKDKKRIKELFNAPIEEEADGNKK